MNKTQKEIAMAQLKDEERALKELKQAYSKAKKDTEAKIAALAARKDMENLQSIVYQMKYQKAILEQIDGVLKDLNQGQYSTISDFANGAYANGYIGSMYDLQKQGIPMTVPVDPEKMQRAIMTDSKISKSYYQNRALPENLSRLKKKIRTELTRGIASGKTWPEVAYQVAQGMNSPFKRAMSDAMRIVRTEGHRINQEGFLDAGRVAKDNGADVLKQWDATLDDNTRPAHAEADGQIVEWDEPFIVDGEELEAPGVGGSAGNVINCRCQLLQRARWALDQDELDQLQERADFFGLDKSDSFEEFKQKYLNISNDDDTIKLPDTLIHRSVGAKARNYDIVEPGTGDIFHFAEGTKIQNSQAFAGKGTKHPLNEAVAEGLAEQIGGKPENWRHCKGNGVIDFYGEERDAEVHWFEEESVGKHKFKVKRWLDED